jgi:hypothetical protein
MALQAIPCQHWSNLGFKKLFLLMQSKCGRRKWFPLCLRPHFVILFNFSRRQCTTINGDQMERSQPGPVRRCLVGQNQRIAQVPIGKIPDNITDYLLLTVKINVRHTLPVPSVDNVCKAFSNGPCGSRRRWDAVGTGLGGSQTHIDMVLFLTQRNISLASIGGKRNNPRRAGLAVVVRFDPHLDGYRIGSFESPVDFFRRPD